jgi:hypothetical protein
MASKFAEFLCLQSVCLLQIESVSVIVAQCHRKPTQLASEAKVALLNRGKDLPKGACLWLWSRLYQEFFEGISVSRQFAHMH